jgi:chromosome segregation ATPase
MTKRELSKRIEEMSREIWDINNYLSDRIELNKKFNDYKKQSEQKISNLRGYIGSHTWAISVNTDKKLSALQNKIDSLKNEIKYLKAVVSKNDDKYEMLLDYLELEEKEYAELEEQGKFRTFKDISNLIGEPINMEAVKKTKLVKKKVGKTDIPQTGRI